jgi:putative endonuclease
MLKLLYVYILECADKSFYIGVTNDVERRFNEHQNGRNEECYTYKRRPVTLVYYESYRDYKQAIRREKQLKGWTRAKKIALIRGDLNKLKQLSNHKNIINRV